MKKENAKILRAFLKRIGRKGGNAGTEKQRDARKANVAKAAARRWKKPGPPAK